MSEDRIEQFRRMAEADPENELGHFSLGKALLEADHPEGAIPSLQRVIELNDTFSKAYQLLGEAQARTGDTDAAVETLTRGFRIAAQRGDRMPADAMRDQLRQLGADAPQVDEPDAAEHTAEPSPGAAREGFVCARCGSTEPLPEPPFKGDLGRRVQAHTCASCWREWIGMGTKVINELRLDFSRDEDQKVYEQHMLEWLGVSPDEVEQYAREKSER
jgi:Fe-S cluster biosynthesis and repair protein YggX